jgi:hypothetical protein
MSFESEGHDTQENRQGAPRLSGHMEEGNGPGEEQPENRWINRDADGQIRIFLLKWQAV